ncbi:uncharacterized protein LOC144651373 [Oculina patagonica]
MKLFASRIGLLFAVVFAMSFALHRISAMDETLDGLRREMEDDEKHPQPLRERRSVKNNATQDILKRLQDMEKKHNESTKRLKKLEKRNLEAKMLPPMRASLLPYIIRANVEAMRDISFTTSCPDIPPLKENCFSKHQGAYVPVMCLSLPAL